MSESVSKRMKAGSNIVWCDATGTWRWALLTNDARNGDGWARGRRRARLRLRWELLRRGRL